MSLSTAKDSENKVDSTIFTVSNPSVSEPITQPPPRTTLPIYYSAKEKSTRSMLLQSGRCENCNQQYDDSCTCPCSCLLCSAFFCCWAFVYYCEGPRTIRCVESCLCMTKKCPNCGTKI